MRKSGILMHISSLPSEFGIGKLGDSAYMFANFLRDCGVQVWQILPLSPTSYGDSPVPAFFRPRRQIPISLISSGWKSRAIWHRRITRTLSGARPASGRLCPRV